jgi:hypothetical protein
MSYKKDREESNWETEKTSAQPAQDIHAAVLEIERVEHLVQIIRKQETKTNSHT